MVRGGRSAHWVGPQEQRREAALHRLDRVIPAIQNEGDIQLRTDRQLVLGQRQLATFGCAERSKALGELDEGEHVDIEEDALFEGGSRAHARAAAVKEGAGEQRALIAQRGSQIAEAPEHPRMNRTQRGLAIRPNPLLERRAEKPTKASPALEHEVMRWSKQISQPERACEKGIRARRIDLEARAQFDGLTRTLDHVQSDVDGARQLARNEVSFRVHLLIAQLSAAVRRGARRNELDVRVHAHERRSVRAGIQQIAHHALAQLFRVRCS